MDIEDYTVVEEFSTNNKLLIMRHILGERDKLGRKAVLGIMLILLFIGILMLTFNFRPIRSSHSAVIYIDPSSYILSASEVSVGHKFNVTVKVSDVQNLIAWQVRIYYDRSILEVSRFLEPSWDPEYVFYGESTMFLTSYPEDPSDESAVVGALLFPLSQEPFFGSGKLVIIEFEILVVPQVCETYSSVLNISNRYTYLLDAPDNYIPAEKQNGYYEIKCSLVGDVNIDGTVDVQDIFMAALSFGSYPTHPRWNPNADFTKDNKIDLRDIYLTAKNFGKQA